MTVSVAQTEPELGGAVELGWRIAELYALVDDLDPPLMHTLLPGHHSLPKKDQLELQVRAAAGDARRTGIPAIAAALEDLVPHAREAPDSLAKTEAFRLELRACHIELDKQLWASKEALGKAYELGNGLSDTYGRISRAYRTQSDRAVRREWEEVFSTKRIENLKKLLDDLQSRLDSHGATVVASHLDAWQRRVTEHLARPGSELPTLERVRRALRRQTIIWRQLLAGDKAPEAYLDRKERAEVHRELKKLVWRGYRAWMPVAAVVVAVIAYGAAHLGDVSSWYESNVAATGAGTALLGIAGALGITKASVTLTVRTRVHEWSELLWNRALVKRIGDVTLAVHDVFPPQERSHALGALSAAREHVRRSGQLAGDTHARHA